MDFLKRLLGVETDKEWFARAPFGPDTNTGIVVVRHEGIRHRVDMADAVLLGHRQGYTGWAAYECMSSLPTSGEIYRTRSGKFLSCFVRKDGSVVETEYALIDTDEVYEKLTDGGWHLTPAGHEALREIVTGFPVL